MKTIKQIADELGVTKQAIRNQIANLGLQSSLRKNANHFAIDEQQEALIKQAFDKKSQSENANQSQSETETALRFTLRLLEQEIEFLKSQIETKDEQIRSLTSAVEAQAKSIMAESVMDVQQKMIEDGQTKRRWQFWKWGK